MEDHGGHLNIRRPRGQDPPGDPRGGTQADQTPKFLHDFRAPQGEEDAGREEPALQADLTKVGEREKGKAPATLRQFLPRLTVAQGTREAFFDFHAITREEPAAFRFAAYCELSTWVDQESGRILVPYEAIESFFGRKVGRGFTTFGGLKQLQQWFPRLDWYSYRPPNHPQGGRCRALVDKPTHPGLSEIVAEDLRTPVSELEDRAYLLTGKPYSKRRDYRARKKIQEQLEGNLHFPSDTTRRNCHVLNDLPSNAQTRQFRDEERLQKAREYVRRMDLSDKDRGEDLRRHWLTVIRAVEDQPKQFYRPSASFRTDRVFGANPGAFYLPKPVRKILCSGLIEIDLACAQLRIAAAEWDAEDALEKLRQRDYDVWADLAEHFGHEPGDERFDELKGAAKKAIYSTIFGMEEANVKRAFSSRTKDFLGEDAGQRLAEHPLMNELLAARDEALSEITLTGFRRTVTGRTVTVNASTGVDERSVLATEIQAVEQALMSVILEAYEDQDETDWRPVLWLHDGCYVQFTRRQRTHVEDMKERLQARAEELGVPAFFDVETVTAPDLPPKRDDADSDDQPCDDPNRRLARVWRVRTPDSRNGEVDEVGTRSPPMRAGPRVGQTVQTPAAGARYCRCSRTASQSMWAIGHPSTIPTR